MAGITRANVLALCRRHGIPARELDFSLTQASKRASGAEREAAGGRRLGEGGSAGTRRRVALAPLLCSLVSLSLCKASRHRPPTAAPLLLQLWSADEVFVTGTFAGQIPVRQVDGRAIGAGRGPLVHRLQALYAELCEESAAAGRVPLAP